MPERLVFEENGIHIAIQIAGDGDVWLLHCGAQALDADAIPAADQAAFRLVEVQCSGASADGHLGNKHTRTQPGSRLRYVSHQDVRTPQGRKLMITQAFDAVIVTSFLQFFDDIRALRSWTVVRNSGQATYTLEHVSSFALTGVDVPSAAWPEATLAIPANAWRGEAQWRTRTVADWGLEPVTPTSTYRIARSGTGSLSSAGYLPMGCLAQPGQATLWQIEHNGSWQWEVSASHNRLALELSGPSWQENHWRYTLSPGATFTSVPVAVAFGETFDVAMGEMTRYRRAIRRPCQDNELLPVVFNDRQHGLEADPTASKELPLIEAAAKLGCETYCIDAGWYTAGSWWDGVGEWKPSTARFPNGLSEVVEAIRAYNMTPGLWLEIEAMSVVLPLAQHVPKDWFFRIAGEPVINHGRYQLDFRNPEVVNHADAVIDRLVKQENIGYIKMDYNVDAGPGNEHNASTVGNGLLKHNRAYLAWLDRVLARYPWLVVENSASGGQRMDYALLSRHAIQTVTEQDDACLQAAIAAACATAVTPEQAGICAAPRQGEDAETVVMRLVNGLLVRLQIGGQLNALGEEAQALVEEAIKTYKILRNELPQLIPTWPIGLPRIGAPWLCYVLHGAKKDYVAVWHLGDSGAEELEVPLGPGAAKVRCIYPSFAKEDPAWESRLGTLKVKQAVGTARVYEAVRSGE